MPNGIALQNPEVTAQGWQTMRSISDVDVRAEKWLALRTNAGEGCRELPGRDFVEMPVDAYDAELIAARGADVWNPTISS
jgi:hypothetical protein